MSLSRPLTLALIATTLAVAAGKPRPASEILAAAQATAAAEHKTVLVMFHASWCGWCHRLEKYLDTAEIKPIAQKYFVATWLTIQERQEKQALNTPGAQQVWDQLVGSKNAGLPVFAFLDAQGQPIVTSLRDGKTNIGFPDTPEEIAWFLTMVKKAAPSVTPDELAALEHGLRTR